MYEICYGLFQRPGQALLILFYIESIYGSLDRYVSRLSTVHRIELYFALDDLRLNRFMFVPHFRVTKEFLLGYNDMFHKSLDAPCTADDNSSCTSAQW